MINEIQRLLAHIADGGHLSREETSRAFQIIMMGAATPAQVAALLMGLRLRGETVEEIAGAALTLRAKMEKIVAPEDAIDVCGTGGDGLKTLNISTAVALVVAAAGVPVAKHGNKSVSSLSGSADVLTELGVNVQADKAQVEASLREANICFMYAPLFHKAMRHVAPIRQELGIRTVFNLLGPLANPAQPKCQLMGVYNKSLLEPVAQVLQRLGSVAAWVVHGSDGLDELTITSTTHVAQLKDGEIKCFDVTPEEAGLERADLNELRGGNPVNNARELSLLLTGKRSAYREVVLLNAGAALFVAGRAEHLRQGVEIARAALDEGRAKETLARLAHITSQS